MTTTRPSTKKTAAAEHIDGGIRLYLSVNLSVAQLGALPMLQLDELLRAITTLTRLAKSAEILAHAKAEREDTDRQIQAMEQMIRTQGPA